MKTFACLLFCLTLSNAHASVKERERAAIEVLNDTVYKMAKEDLTCKTAKACTYINYGDMGCGGMYTMTSVNNRNMKELKFIAERSNVRAEAYGRRYDEDECVDYEDTEVKCINRKCVEVPVGELR